MAFKITESPIRRVSITPPPGGWSSPRKLSPIPPSEELKNSTTTVWSNVAGVKDEDDKFRVNLDVCNFNTNDLSIKSIGNRLIIEGKQIERQPNSPKYLAREFNLNYVLPQDVDVNELKSSISERGMLTIEAPKMPTPKPSPMNRRKN